MIAEYQQPITIDKLYSYLLSMLLWFLFHVSYWRSHIGGVFLRLNVRCVGIQDIKVFEPDSWFTVRCLYPVVTTLVNDVDGPYGRSAEDNHIILWPVDSVCLFFFFFFTFFIENKYFYPTILNTMSLKTPIEAWTATVGGPVGSVRCACGNGFEFR